MYASDVLNNWALWVKIFFVWVQGGCRNYSFIPKIIKVSNIVSMLKTETFGYRRDTVAVKVLPFLLFRWQKSTLKKEEQSRKWDTIPNIMKDIIYQIAMIKICNKCKYIYIYKSQAVRNQTKYSNTFLSQLFFDSWNLFFAFSKTVIKCNVQKTIDSILYLALGARNWFFKCNEHLRRNMAWVHKFYGE